MKFRTFAACSLLAFANSCVLFTPDESAAPTELAKDTEKPDYLKDGGPTTKIDIAPGQQSLLEILKEAKEQLAESQRELSELRSNLRAAQMRLDESGADLESSKTKEAALESELKLAQSNLRDIEARLLDAALEKAKLQRRALELEILNVQNKLSKLDASPGRE